MTDVTKLEHARALKAMGAPLNMRVQEREFSAEYTRGWLPTQVRLFGPEDENT